jgi:hypothetical protein
VDGPRLARENVACRTEVACSHVSGLFTQSGWTAGPDGVREPTPHHSSGISRVITLSQAPAPVPWATKPPQPWAGIPSRAASSIKAIAVEVRTPLDFEGAFNLQSQGMAQSVDPTQPREACRFIGTSGAIHPIIRSPHRRGRAASEATARPSIRAVSALITRSNLLDCTTGRISRRMPLSIVCKSPVTLRPGRL